MCSGMCRFVSLSFLITKLTRNPPRNEKASSVYTTDLLTKILKEEGEKLFDARSASLGHTLQGGIPSPLDRSRAVRLASKCMAFLEGHAKAIGKDASHSRPRRAPTETAAMIAIEGTTIKFVPVREVVEFADMKNRRAKKSWWEPYKGLAESLGGLPQLDFPA